MDYKDFSNFNTAGLYHELLVVPDNAGLGDLNRMMQQITEHALERLGMSVEELFVRKMLWVICFSQINIQRMPVSGESVMIYTWPGADKMGMYTRRYVFFTENGEELLNAASMFSLVDQTTRTMVLPANSGFILPTVQMPGEAQLPKLSVKAPGMTHESHHPVSKNEIDQNTHVNNAYYLDWCGQILKDTFPGNTPEAKNIWISYAKEIVEGDDVTLNYSVENGELFVKGHVQEESRFTVKISF